MKGLLPLLKKEIIEQLRTYRVVVVGGVFLLFGITTPLLFRYMNEFIARFGGGVAIEMPPPTAAQSLVGYSGDLAQIGVLVAVLVAMGSVSNELQRGTAVITLSKPVSRTAFVTAKLLAMGLTFLVSTVVASVFCFAYTVWLIGDANVGDFVILNALMVLFLTFSLAVTVLFSSMFRSSLAAGGIAAAALISQAIISPMPVIGKFMPGQLLGWGNGLVMGIGTTYWWALGITVALIGLCVYLAQRALKKKEM
jgi:ABC-2 type transport system permease protein